MPKKVAPNLLARLRQGPLSSDDFAEVGSSRKSLHVRINKLRERGHNIVSTGGGRTLKVVEYVLQEATGDDVSSQVS
jgi:biotin operon repressor